MPATVKHTLNVSTLSDTEILITRDLNASRRLVWDALTRPELIKRWLFTPPGWTMTRCEEDLRVGGRFRWEWNGPDGALGMIMRGVYRELVAPERAMRTEEFVIGDGQSMGEHLARTVLTEDATQARTTVAITLQYASKAARDGMLASGMEQGMSAGYDNLDRVLAELR